MYLRLGAVGAGKLRALGALGAPLCGPSSSPLGVVHGVSPSQGVAESELPSGEILSAELHWGEATGIGRREFKIHRLL